MLQRAAVASLSHRWLSRCRCRVAEAESCALPVLPQPVSHGWCWCCPQDLVVLDEPGAWEALQRAMRDGREGERREATHALMHTLVQATPGGPELAAWANETRAKLAPLEGHFFGAPRAARRVLSSPLAPHSEKTTQVVSRARVLAPVLR